MAAEEIEKGAALDGQVVSRERAQETAEGIRQHLGGAAELARRAWDEEHWKVLGYGSWASYATAEFGSHRVEARRAVAQLLSGEGMSTRQIAEATGTPRSTVSDDLSHAASPNVTRVSAPPDTSPDQPTSHEGVTPWAALDAQPAAQPGTGRHAKTPAERQRKRRARQREDTAVAPGVKTVSQGTALLSAQARGDQLQAKADELEAEVAKLAAERDQLAAKLAEVQALHDKASARVDQLEKDNLLLRVRVEELEEAITLPVPDPVAAGPDSEPELPPDPEPVAAPRRLAFEEMLAMGGPVTGPCSKCKKDRSRPVLVEGQDEGKFACESCYAEAEQKGDPVSRP
jgi:hypothetical protein